LLPLSSTEPDPAGDPPERALTRIRLINKAVFVNFPLIGF